MSATDRSEPRPGCRVIGHAREHGRPGEDPRTSGPAMGDAPVLIIGASGFIGSALIGRLAGSGIPLVGLDRAGPSGPPAPSNSTSPRTRA